MIKEATLCNSESIFLQAKSKVLSLLSQGQVKLPAFEADALVETPETVSIGELHSRAVSGDFEHHKEQMAKVR